MEAPVIDLKSGDDLGTTWSFDRIRFWCVDTALPFWAEAGFDRRANAFHERLDFTGAPILAAPRRTMVQGRQIYAFAHAALLGWLPEGAELAIVAADNMIRLHWASDNEPGWVFSVSCDGAVVDARRDAYTQAFALYGLAWAYRLSAAQRYRDVADQTFDFLDRRLSSSASGIDVQAGTRRQNPHMHMFEAALAWFEVTGNDQYLARATEIFRLFTTRFFQPHTAILVEHFDEDWRPAPDHRGHLFEPGHHFEWVWLLRRYGHHTGHGVDKYADALLGTALAMGFADGLIAAEVQDDATIFNREHRVWPHAEGIKAAAAEHEAGRGSMRELVDRLVLVLESRFLGKPFAAGWLDHFSPDGSLKIDFVPASTLYHLVLGIAEADRVFNTVRKSQGQAPLM
ncbi:AGE family epimerase/isomerase [Mesorhizobium sp. KR9-304]|uniref:AGE family epimerase/isomerase n=1 Tax=Mesorhizobium sp. KR9-304 TaxID=3156614 RepID=UPI0032B3A25E